MAVAPLPEPLERHLLHLQVQRRLAPRTLAMYREAFGRLAAFAAEVPVDVEAVTIGQVRRWAAALHGRGLAPRSIAIVLSAWRGFYRRLGQDGRIACNPVDGVRAPRAQRPLPKALAVDQAVALAEARPAAPPSRPADDPRTAALAARDHAIVELLYGCGLRVGELVGLELRPPAPAAAGGPASTSIAPGWIDLADATVRVTGKGGKVREVPMGDAARGALREWLARRGTLAADGEPALFVGTRGTRLSPSQVRVRLAQLARQAGLPTHVHPHMLRHSFASHLLQSSGDLRGVQELLGHAHIATTQVYTRLDFGHLSKVYDAAHPRAKRRSGG